MRTFYSYSFYYLFRGAVKRLFNQSPAAGPNGSSFTKRFRGAREAGKAVGTLSPLPTLKSISRRRHRSGPTKEIAFPARNGNQVESSKDAGRSQMGGGVFFYNVTASWILYSLIPIFVLFDCFRTIYFVDVIKI